MTEGETMSAGGFSYALGTAAGFVLRSLMEHSDLQTPEEIADAPHAGEEIDSDTAHRALRELESHGLAAESSDGRWELTEAGRSAKAA
jgi:DNA-binding IclR family transcriptional regulator